MICCLALAVPFALATAGEVRGDSGMNKSPEELIEEGARRILQGIEVLIDSIPTYGVPRIEENGDIVIPRRDPRPRQAPRDDENSPQNETEPEDT